MSNEVRKLLQRVAERESFGALSAERDAKIRSRVFSRVALDAAKAPRLGVLGALRAPFYGMGFSPVLKPVGVLFALFVAVMGSAMGVFASVDSLPGDPLYRVKLASERARLSFAGSDEEQARLFVEFSGRRADEVSRILEKPATVLREAQVKEAVSNLRWQVTSVRTKLSALHKEQKDEAVPLAKLVDRKVTDVEETLSASKEKASESVRADVEEAAALVRIATVEALKVMAEKEGTVAETDTLAKKVAAQISDVRTSHAVALKLVADEKAELRTCTAQGLLQDADKALLTTLKEADASLVQAGELLVAAEAAVDKKVYTTALENSERASKLVEDVRKLFAPHTDAVKSSVIAPKEQPTTNVLEKTETQGVVPKENPVCPNNDCKSVETTAPKAEIPTNTSATPSGDDAIQIKL